MLPAYGVFRWGYLNMENVLYSFYKIIFKNACKSNTSQPCLHTLISTLLFTNESARSSAVGITIFHRRASMLWIIFQSVQTLLLILLSVDNSILLCFLASSWDLCYYFLFYPVSYKTNPNSQSHAHVSPRFTYFLRFDWVMVWLLSLCLSNSFVFPMRIVSL